MLHGGHGIAACGSAAFSLCRLSYDRVMKLDFVERLLLRWSAMPGGGVSNSWLILHWGGGDQLHRHESNMLVVEFFRHLIRAANRLFEQKHISCQL